MSDDINIKLDGSQFEKAAEPALEALRELRAAVVALDSTSAGRLRKEMQALKTGATSALMEIETVIKAMPKMIADEVKRSVAATTKAAKDAGKVTGQALVDSTVLTVRANRQKIQAEYEAAIASGAKMQAAALRNLKFKGVQLYPEDAEKIRLDDMVAKSASKIDVRSILGLDPVELRKSARDSAEVFKAAFADEMSVAKMRTASASRVDVRTLLGLEQTNLRKSARESADVFRQAFAEEANVDKMRTASASRIDVRTLLGLEQTNLRKSARESADVFKQAFAEEANVDKMRTASASRIDVRTLLGLDQTNLRKSARESAAVFKEAFAAEANIDKMRTASASRVDVRTLLGLEQTNLRKSARESAAVFKEAFAAEAKTSSLRAASASNIDVATLLGLPQESLKKSARDSADVFKAALAGKAVEATAQATSELGKYRSELGLTGKAQVHLNSLFRDGHSAARGLASGFNAMWLTWGALGPLLAGAAVSNAFSSTISKGSEFEQTLAAIRYMGGESAKSVDELANTALNLARVGPMGPLEIAKALKVLSLAGLDAQQQMAAIKPVMDFSIAGEVSLEKSAETLVAVSEAYGYSAEGFSSVSDVIAKAAAISMSSVDSMSESFKMASTVAQQFGVSLEDSATTLALLSQIGIKGTAAGTAMRNMYNELMGSSKKARKVLEDTLKIDIFDNATKKVKPLQAIFDDMAESLSKLDFKSQQRALQELGNERGLKALSANLMAINQQANEMGTDLPNRLAEIRKALEDAPGFSAMAAIGMAQTTQNQIKGVFASLEAALTQAFGRINPQIQSAALNMRALFNSDEFVNGISSLVGSIASLIQTLVENVDVIKGAVVVYGTYKLAMLAVTAGTAAWTAVTTAYTAVAGTATVATVGFTAAVRAASAALGPIALLIAAVGAAWALYANKTESAMDKATFAIDSHYASTKDAMEAEIKRLDLSIQKTQEELDGKVVARSVEAQLAVDRLHDLHKEELAAAQTRVEVEKLNNARMRAAVGDDKTPYAQKLINDTYAKDKQLNSDLVMLVKRQEGEVAELERTSAAVKEKAKILAELQKKLAEQNRVVKAGSGILPEDPDRKTEAAINASKRYLEQLTKETEQIGHNALQRKVIEMDLEAAKAEKTDPALAEKIREQGKAYLERAANYEYSQVQMANANKMAAEFTGLTDDIQKLKEQVVAEEAATKAILEQVSATKASESAKLLEAAATAEQIAMQLDLHEGTAAEIRLYREKAEWLRKLANQKQATSDAKETIEAQKKEIEGVKKLLEGVDDVAHDVFMAIADGGEDAFKRIGESIKKYVLEMLYQLTVRRWIIQIAGSIFGDTGAAAASSILQSQGTSAVSSMFSSSGAGGSMVSSGASLGYGAVQMWGGNAAAGYASAVPGLTSSASGSQAAMLASQTGDMGVYGMAATAEAGGSAAGGAYTAGANSWLASIPWWGWVILAVIVFWDELFGRSLSGVGTKINMDGNGNITANDYKHYSGGLFRSDKTKIGADSTNTPQSQALIQQVKNVQMSAAAMAQAMGHSSEAIMGYTGTLTFNFKGVKDAQEAQERVNKKLQEFRRQLLNTIPGLHFSKKEFEKFMQTVQQSVQQAGISAQGMAEVISQGMIGQLDASQVGAQLADIVLGGIYRTIVAGYADMIAQAFMTQIIEPIFMAVMAGVPISQAISKAAIENVVNLAKRAAEALSAIFSNAEFQGAMDLMRNALNDIGAAVVKPSTHIKKFGTAALNASNSLANAAAQIKQTWQGIADSILGEMKRIKDEILGDTTSPGAVLYAQAQFDSAVAKAKKGDKTAAESLPELSRTLLELGKANASSRAEYRLLQGSVLMSLEATRQFIKKKFKIDLPAFDVGTNYVPNDMVAVIHEGEAIVPKRYNPAANGSDGGMTEELAAAFDRMTALLGAIHGQNSSVVKNTNEMRKVLVGASNGDYELSMKAV